MIFKYRIIAVILVVALTPAFVATVLAEEDFAVSVYLGRMTDGDFGDAISGKADFIDAYVVVGALSWTFARYFEDALSFELEGQIGKWWGDQDNVEFNLPLAIRWNKFPWDRYVSTSLAYGLGPSYATEEPEAELDLHDKTKKFMVYWFGEIAIGPPDSDWAGILRIHHRSGAFGLIADHGEGGSNTLAAGLKYRF